VVVSRTDPIFMERLFEIEVPEVYDGIVEIKKVARIPGDRAKVAVTSHDDRVDPVGACVGVKGVRIHAVVRELSNENIDVMEWSDNPHQLVARALSPANPTSVKLNDAADPPRARVEVVADEVSQAIGKKGVNIKLASKLTGYEIDVYREIPADEEDIDIEEFGDELDEKTIEKLKHIGCDTGKAVLELSADALARRADLPRETAQRVMDIIEAEFEKGPGVVDSLERGEFTIEGVKPAPGASDTAEAEVTNGDESAERAAEASRATDEASTDTDAADVEEDDQADDASAESEDEEALADETEDDIPGDEDVSDDETASGEPVAEPAPDEASNESTAPPVDASEEEKMEGEPEV